VNPDRNNSIRMADHSNSGSAARLAARGSFSRWWAKARASIFWMVLIAMVLRLGFIVIGHTYRFKTLDDNFSFGFEMGRIGRSLAEGHGFSSPFSGSTGPTAWEPPLYPLLIAGVFKLFGVYTRASALVLLTINSLFSALTCIPIFLIGRRCFNEKVAAWSAWTWALRSSASTGAPSSARSSLQSRATKQPAGCGTVCCWWPGPTGSSS